LIGKSISRYKILSKLGEGGMGAVYLAEDTSLDRKVALKVLSDALAANPEHLERFEREAKAIAAIEHPNIVTIYSVEEVDGLRFLTMGYVEGQTLDQVIPSTGMRLEELLRIAKPLVEALIAAHGRGIIHRDLKPANVMVTPAGGVKVLDFGLAKLRPEAEGEAAEEAATQALTQQGQIMGTVPYMSPEQVQGRTADHRSDIFSLGIILYEMATGSRPFQGDTSADTISAILRDTPDSVTDLRVEIPPQVSRLIGRCLEKEIQRRYQSAADLKADLDQLGQQTAPVVKKKDQAPSMAVLPFVDMSPQKDQDYFCEGIAEELINGLARIENLRVASRTSSFQVSTSGLDIREIGKQLGVSTVLEGSVRKAGDQLRITAQLVNVEDGYRLWTDRFDRTLKDVFAIQDEIAESIVEALRVTLSPKERRAMQQVATRNVEAYDCYLKGRKFFYQMTGRSAEFARQMYQQAIEIDPQYALAYAGIADCHSFLYTYSAGTQEHLDGAAEASHKALELDPASAEAHASRGLALSVGGRHEEAEDEFKAAIALDQKLFEAYYFFGRDCLAQGQFAMAAQLFEQASAVRPEDYQAPMFLSQALHGMGTPKEQLNFLLRQVIENVRTHVQLNPDDPRALYLGAGALIELDQREEGLQWARQALASDPEEPNVLYNVACAFARADEPDEALDLLERAVAAGFGYRAWLENDVDFESIRQSPRFQALLESMT
jgi:serine/threonine protein kinase/tetratricopeptide (TPR) repeat protein